MKTKIRNFVAAISMLGPLASSAQADVLKVQSDNTSTGAQNIRTLDDHASIATRYENTAKELRVKAEEGEKMLQHYEDNRHLFGRNGQDFQAQAVALARKYNLAAEKAAAQAAFHHRMSELAKLDHTAAGEPLHQASNR